MVSRLRHVDVLQFAWVMAVFYALLGIILGLLWWLVLSPIMIAAIKAVPGSSAASTGVLTGLGVLAVIFFPIFYAIVGFIAGLIYAALYNLAARWTGGFAFTLEPVTQTMPVRTV